MIYQVRLYGDPVLRKVASPIKTFDAELKRLAEDMIETMYHFNGIGLAAPQIGISKRLFVAAEPDPALRNDTDEDHPPQTIDEKRKAWGIVKEHIIVNPVIQKREGLQYGADGCLSLPGLQIDEMKRDETLTMRYQDLEGTHHTTTLSGRFSHIVQHEYDHLEGVLFFDRLTKDEKEQFMTEHREAMVEMQREAKAFLKELKINPEAYKVQ